MVRVLCYNIFMKKLYRSRSNKVITGLIGGMGEYLDVDPSILRVIYVFFIFFGMFFLPVLAYFVASAIVPEEPYYLDKKGEKDSDGKKHKEEE